MEFGSQATLVNRQDERAIPLIKQVCSDLTQLQEKGPVIAENVTESSLTALYESLLSSIEQLAEHWALISPDKYKYRGKVYGTHD